MQRPTSLPMPVLEQLFTEARSHHAWTPAPVSDEELRQLYALFKWGPTSVNSNPGRFVFLTNEAAKSRLYPALMQSNTDQVRAAPVTVIVAHDAEFHHRVAALYPAFDATEYFASDEKLRADTAFRNSSLQGAYAILAARALGYDVCPMSGFDNAVVDAAFFAGTTVKSNFVFTLGHADHSAVQPRNARLTFDEACTIL
jgi:3-hydroxypropanoate dehydrogenase